MGTREIFNEMWDEGTDFRDFANVDSTFQSSLTTSWVWERKRKEALRENEADNWLLFHFIAEETEAQRSLDSPVATQLLSGRARFYCLIHLPLTLPWTSLSFLSYHSLQDQLALQTTVLKTSGSPTMLYFPTFPLCQWRKLRILVHSCLGRESLPLLSPTEFTGPAPAPASQLWCWVHLPSSH